MPKVASKRVNKSRNSFFLDEAEQVEVKVGDCVLIQAETGSLPFVGRVKKITQVSDDVNDMDCLVSWFYRPEEARGGRKSFHGERELFSSDHDDMAHKTTMMSKCQVYTLEEYERLGEYNETDFFTRFLYRAQTKTYEPDNVPVFCVCEMPYNPDQLMLCCDGCTEWFHPDCLSLPADMVRGFTAVSPFHCPDCMDRINSGAGVEGQGALGCPADADEGGQQGGQQQQRAWQPSYPGAGQALQPPFQQQSYDFTQQPQMQSSQLYQQLQQQQQFQRHQAPTLAGFGRQRGSP